jgi:hypothetical protein
MRSAWLLGGVAAVLVCACGGDDDDVASGWSAAEDPPEVFSMIDVWAFADDDVWFLDGSATVHRHDGASWSTLETPSTGGLGCIFATSASEVWLCAGTEVLYYDGSDFTATDVTGPTGLDGLVGIWATSDSAVWAIGDDGIVAHWDGAAWTGTIAGSPFNSSVWGSGADDIYVLGTFDLIHWDGGAWSTVELPGAGGGDGQVWGTGSSDVWVMTGSDTFLHYDGASWQEIETDMVGDGSAVWGASPDDLWAVGSPGSFAHYDGDSWDERAHQDIGAPYLRQLVAIHGSSATNIWAVGAELGEGGSTPLIFHYDP